jgi:hypothetical protein
MRFDAGLMAGDNYVESETLPLQPQGETMLAPRLEESERVYLHEESGIKVFVKEDDGYLFIAVRQRDKKKEDRFRLTSIVGGESGGEFRFDLRKTCGKRTKAK